MKARVIIFNDNGSIEYLPVTSNFRSICGFINYHTYSEITYYNVNIITDDKILDVMHTLITSNTKVIIDFIKSIRSLEDVVIHISGFLNQEDAVSYLNDLINDDSIYSIDEKDYLMN